MTHFVYILRCRDGALYTGSTNNLEKRMKEHSEGKGSKFVRSRLPFRLVYTEQTETLSAALKRENQIKMMSRAGKANLVRIKEGSDNI